MKYALRYTVLWGMLILWVGNVKADQIGTLSFASFPRSPDLYLIDNTGKNFRKLTTDHINKGSPAWSPDGRFFAYHSNVDGDPDIYVMDVRNKTSRQLTNHPERDLSPAWSPNGKWIAFESDRTGDLDIYRIDVDGSNLKRLTNRGDNQNPAWAPDSQWIAYCFTVLPELKPGQIILADKLWRDNVIRIINTDGQNDGQPLEATRGVSSSPVWVPESFFPVSPQPQLLSTQWGQLKK